MLFDAQLLQPLPSSAVGARLGGKDDDLLQA